MAAYELAQLNVGRLRAPIDAEATAGFVAALDPVNALADHAPGFVWRLQTEDGNATAVHVTDDPLFIINMSVWESIDALAAFVYKSAHTDVMRQRAAWFHRSVEAYLVLWWVPAGHRPTPDEAIDRLARLRRDGPTPHAFTFRQPFPPPGDANPVDVDDGWTCSV
jgi:hypothetical protein